MKHIVPFIITCLLALCASVAQAQIPQDTDRCGAMPAFSASLTPGLEDQVLIPGVQNQRIASFRIRSGRNEAKDVYSTTFHVNIPTGLGFQNMAVKVNGVTQNFVVPFIEDGISYTFTPPKEPTRISTCGYVTVDVLVDVLSGTLTGTYQPIKLVGAIATGVTSNTNQTLTHAFTGVPVSVLNPVFGQTFSVVSGGSANLTNLFSNLFGTPGKEAQLGSWILTASNAEDVRTDAIRTTLRVLGGAQCTGVHAVRLVAQSGAGTFEATGNSLISSGVNYYSEVFFPGAGVLVPRNTQAVITAYGVIREDCKVSTILTEIVSSSDIRLYGLSSNTLLPVSGTFPSSGGIVDVK